ncbi:MAG: TIGR01459 family HAD-type hydrolase [Rickettsiales bacterium]|nr:TIGR01459 family HAD-type hydrolase [Rickettsiales bacterium]
MKEVIYIEGLSSISQKYDTFFIDLWGVVHNGVNLFEHVLDTLVKLKKMQKKILFLTNAPRRSHIISEQLNSFGLNSSLYRDIVSSGEVTWQNLKIKKNPKKNKCFLIGPERDFHLIQGLNLRIVKSTKDVDIIINTGPWGDSDKLENYENTLNELAKNKAPMICSNPDKVVFRGEKLMICAGTLADYYEKIGGKVIYYGKPYKDIYHFCYQLLKNRDRILVIGDSLGNDIAGAQQQGLDSVLVTSGIHRDVNNKTSIDIKKLNVLMEKKLTFPNFVMKELKY